MFHEPKQHPSNVLMSLLLPWGWQEAWGKSDWSQTRRTRSLEIISAERDSTERAPNTSVSCDTCYATLKWTHTGTQHIPTPWIDSCLCQNLTTPKSLLALVHICRSNLVWQCVHAEGIAPSGNYSQSSQSCMLLILCTTFSKWKNRWLEEYVANHKSLGFNLLIRVWRTSKQRSAHGGISHFLFCLLHSFP